MITVKDVAEKLHEKENISISLIQREMSVGFIKANSLFKELEDGGFIIKNKNNKYLFNKDKLKAIFGIDDKPGLKIIFLDIDGVLNCSNTKDRCEAYVGIEDKKVELLKQIVDATKAKLVLVSTWRYTWFKEDYLKSKQDELANYLDAKLAKYGLSIYDKTDDEAIGRGQGIIEYLNNQNEKVDSFIVIDDEMFDYKETKLTKNLIQTSYDKGGLQNKHISKAIDKLM